MLTTNLDVEDRLINGQIRTVVKIKINPLSSKPELIYIKFDDNKAGRQRIQKSGDSYAKSHGVVPIEPVLTRIKLKENRPSSPEIQRTQFPLTLAWACTVHKVQGLTLDKIVFSFDSFKQRQFNYGQVYVALSKVKSSSQLYLLDDYNSAGIKADPRVVEEYDSLRAESVEFDASNIICDSKPNNIVLSLLNIIRKTLYRYKK